MRVFKQKRADFDDWLPLIVIAILLAFIVFFIGSYETQKQALIGQNAQEQTLRMESTKLLMDFLDSKVNKDINYGSSYDINYDAIAQEAYNKGLRVIDLIALKEKDIGSDLIKEDILNTKYIYIIKKMADEYFNLYYGAKSWKFNVEYKDSDRYIINNFETGKISGGTTYNTKINVPSLEDIAIISLTTKR